MLAAAALVVLTGCQTVGFYSQAVGGQLAIMRQQQPVERVIGDPDTPAELKARLELAWEILAFAKDSLALEVDGRYQRYADIGREYVVWNVVAAPRYSLEPIEWCYPVVGCAPYRGYFAEGAAVAFAAKLDADGFETYLGGAAAYSTLGWFDDPLLSSFLDYPPARLAELLFHELAHGRVWVKGDVAFNEAFASFVGKAGARQWLGAEERAAFDRANRAAAAFDRWADRSGGAPRRGVSRS